MEKTHYRKVFKSDHLGVADLEDLIESKSNLIFTIRQVKQEIGARVAGRKGNFNIAYFEEGIKPLVLNATNSKTMRGLSGSSFVEDWAGMTIQLYIDKSASFGGEVTGGVRINPNRVSKQKPVLTPDNSAWPNAVAAFKRDGHLNAVLEHMFVSDEHQQQIAQEADNVS